MSKILLINGPNLNLLGTREPHIYGATTLAQIESSLSQEASQGGHQLKAFQSNHEGQLVDFIQTEGKGAWAIINLGALTHTSLAVPDAISAVGLKFVEVHISNVYAREAFRHHSYLSALAQGVIVGFGVQGYSLALQRVLAQLKES